jgi:hypothetical protein
MTNRRLYAIVLLAALALLQARLAFAGCFMPESATAPAMAGCCLDHMSPDSDPHAVDEPAMACAQHCLESSRTAGDPDVSLLVGSELAVPSSPPLLRSALYPPSSSSLRLAGNDTAHPPHTRLVYVLQRLLI